MGLLIVAISGVVRATANGDTGYPLLLFSLVLAGIGVGCTIAPSTASIMSALPPEKAGVGSAINDAARQVGAATGVAVIGSVWASSFHDTIQQTATAAGVPQGTVDASSSSMGSALEAAQHLPANAQHAFVALANDAFVHAADVANVVASVVLVVGAVLAVRYLRQSKAANAATAEGERELDGAHGEVERDLELAEAEAALIDVEPGAEDPLAIDGRDQRITVR
jgi:hypothetical protein